ncbi:MAG: UDP-3-O-(3-hydroxymyristoyl)glucosamine N-acyltransferase [Candidatus Muiribacteriota bacterium]
MKKIKVNRLLDFIEGELFFNNKKATPEDDYVYGLNTLEKASEKEVSFFASKKYKNALVETKALYIIIDEKLYKEVYDLCPEKKFIIVDNPYFGYRQTIELFSEKKIKTGISEKAFISNSASLGRQLFIDNNVTIGENVKIGDNSMIYSGAVLEDNVVVGKNCIVYQNVIIKEKCVLGNDVILQPGVVLGSDGFGFVPQKGRVYKITHIGNVIVENNVEIGSNTTVDRGVVGPTTIGENTKIDNLVHIAHNVRIGKNCFVVAQVGIAGSTVVGNNVKIGGQAGLVGHIKVGNNVTIGAKAVVINNISDNSHVSGFPAVNRIEDMKNKAYIKKLPEIFKKIKKRND